MTPPGFVAVAAREVAWIWRDKVAVILVLVVPLLAFTLLTATFSNAVVRNLRVDVVDEDRTPTSTLFVQAIQSAPGVEVAERSTDLDGAMHAVRAGNAIATVYLPRNLERDVMGGRRPQVVIFYNKQYFSPGNIAGNALQAAVSAAAKELAGRSASTAAATPGPLVVEQYVLSNPALNYAQFLLRAILPTVLHVLVALTGGYAVGSEFSSRSKDAWLASAGGSPVLALTGKLAPYFAIYAVMAVVGLFIIHGLYGVPFRGDALMVGAAGVLLIIAYLSVGALFQLVTRNLATGLSLTSIVCSPAFGFAGVGFPVLAMSPFAQGWGALLPLRWYIQVLFDQAARGVPVADSARPFTVLSSLALVYFGLGWLRLRAIARVPAPPVREEPEEPAARSGVSSAFAAEYGRVLRDRGVFSLVVVGPILYGALYPQPYVGQLIRDIPIAVVDDDGSEVSRRLIETLNAHEAVEVALRPTTLAEAQAALGRREVFGILSIPAGTERDILKGDEARLPAFVDSAYFLLYNRTLQGLLESAGTVGADLISRGARSDGSLYRASLSSTSPVEILSQPLFNPTGGYGSYVVPAAFVLILQQTLLLGAATVGGITYERGGAAARRRRGGMAAVIGQALAHLMLALPGFALYLIVLPRLYGFSAEGRLLDMLALAVPFILSVSFLGQFVGAWFPRRETALLMIIAFSLPLFFLVGVAWPPEAIPELLRRVSFALPSTSGIDGLVRLNQMGASLADVAHDWHRLWVLAAVYALLAVLATRLSTAGRSR
ncbi:ABC transporter permease [Ancylobacter lacus]|uniref:ABC transporter permease n=1 Tax=Ancylobacter lacus TaxID=2579970 RepID=UPI001FE85CF4|nr:ABC transporter permease [Ancylobacter lacus]